VGLIYDGPAAFLYKCRRMYLHEDPGMSRLVPPMDLMSKQQLKKLRGVDDNKKSVTKSPKINRIRWVSVKSGGEDWIEPDNNLCKSSALSLWVAQTPLRPFV
jgi:hypothetical protein